MTKELLITWHDDKSATDWTVRGPETLDYWYEEILDGHLVDAPDEVYDLPRNWSSLEWYRAESFPCLHGDDLHLAIDAQNNKAYVIHDCVTTEISDLDGPYFTDFWKLSLEDQLKSLCEYEPK